MNNIFIPISETVNLLEIYQNDFSYQVQPRMGQVPSGTAETRLHVTENDKVNSIHYNQWVYISQECSINNFYLALIHSLNKSFTNE